MFNMARLNKNAAVLMHKYHAHAATDVTGFGILGHATNLVENQKDNVDFEIHTLPIIANMTNVYRKCGINFKLLEGYSSETSGQYLVVSPAGNNRFKVSGLSSKCSRVSGFCCKPLICFR